MAANRRMKRMASSQPGFIKLKSVSGVDSLATTRRKRLNKNKKKNWNKNIDINDVDEFLQDIRHQERTTGGLLSEKTDETLFFLDVGPPKKAERKVAPVEVKMRRGKPVRPLRIDLILQHDSLVAAPKDVLSYQLPNAKKLRRIAQKAEHLAAKGIVPRRQKKLLTLRRPEKTESKAVTDANNNPERDFYDIWAPEIKSTADPWYLQQTRKSRVKRPEKMNAKPSALPAVEVIAPGGSYNPDFFSHQALLQEAHDVEVKKQKAEDKLVRQLAVNKDHLATEETIFREQVEGLVEQEEDHDDEEAGADDDGVIVGAISQALKKTEKERRKERAEILKEQSRQADKEKTLRQQQLFQLRSIKTSIKQDESDTKVKQIQRKANQEAEKSQPRRLGKLKFQAQDLEVQLSDELAGSLRQLKPEGSVLKDRFKSMQKRNLIEPRERAKFKRRLKVKYQEKRAFREIT